ncbi:hypothetical protein J6590_060109 [Homalodisca vitripennis]|nr:hypothetical protein J6590_104039 [Homalodisca vitripennis]KAG8316015.1 hypothetical protein J6590_060109 [Homalodisca vitripennis]
MGLINTKSRAEVPEDWVKIVKESRRNPSSFEVEVVKHTAVRGWTSFLNKNYATKCPFQSRPVRELHIARGHHLRFRTSYFGAWENASLYKTVPKREPRRKNQRLPPVNIEVSDEFNLPDSCYEEDSEFEESEESVVIERRKRHIDCESDSSDEDICDGDIHPENSLQIINLDLDNNVEVGFGLLTYDCERIRKARFTLRLS